MRTRLLTCLPLFGLAATLVIPAGAGQAPTQADIDKLMAQAATYEPGQSREPFRRIEELVRQSPSSVRKELETGLVRLLAPESTFEARRFACKQLGIVGSNRSLPALSDLLKSNETAGIACLAMTTYPPGKADEVLCNALTSATGTARIQIINTLGDRRDAKAVKLLAQFATDPDFAVARAAVAALGKVGNPAAWQAIASFAKGANPNLQTVLMEATVRCADGLAAAGDRKTATAIYEGLLAPSQPAYVRRAALDALLRLDQAQAEQRILAVLHGSDSTLKPVAIAFVRALPAKNASEIFAAQLTNLPPQEQVWMIASLAARGDVAACTAIGSSLALPDVAVRRAAIGALGRVGNTWCVPLFARALNRSPEAEEGLAIESALIDLPGGAETDQALITSLKQSAGNARAYLITALVRRQGPAANRLLLAEAAQSDPAVAKAALRALAKTATGKELGPLVELVATAGDAEVRSEAESAATQAIARTDPASRSSALVRGAQSTAQSIENRITLLGLLPACGDAPALTALQAATADSKPRISAAAVRALADWPDASAWDALAAIYHQPGSEAARGLALRGLVRLAGEGNTHADAKLVERYRQLLADARGDADLRLILGALGGAAQPGALQLALPLLDNAGVRAEAEVAVRRIAGAIKSQHPQAAQEALNRLKPRQ